MKIGDVVTLRSGGGRMTIEKVEAKDWDIFAETELAALQLVTGMGCIDVLRYGQPWVADLTAANAVSSLMAELDAARVVLQAARQLCDAFEGMPIGVLAEIAKCGDAGVGLVRAVALHDALVDDREPPSEWCR